MAGAKQKAVVQNIIGTICTTLVVSNITVIVSFRLLFYDTGLNNI